MALNLCENILSLYCREMHDWMYNIKMPLVALCIIFMYICIYIEGLMED